MKINDKLMFEKKLITICKKYIPYFIKNYNNKNSKNKKKHKTIYRFVKTIQKGFFCSINKNNFSQIRLICQLKKQI